MFELVMVLQRCLTPVGLFACLALEIFIDLPRCPAPSRRTAFSFSGLKGQRWPRITSVPRLSALFATIWQLFAANLQSSLDGEEHHWGDPREGPLLFLHQKEKTFESRTSQTLPCLCFFVSVIPQKNHIESFESSVALRALTFHPFNSHHKLKQ